jgi:hypothetical protein
VGLAYWNDISRNNTDLCQLDFTVENKILGADVPENCLTPLQSSVIIFNPWVATGNCDRQAQHTISQLVLKSKNTFVAW